MCCINARIFPTYIHVAAEKDQNLRTFLKIIHNYSNLKDNDATKVMPIKLYTSLLHVLYVVQKFQKQILIYLKVNHDQKSRKV